MRSLLLPAALAVLVGCSAQPAAQRAALPSASGTATDPPGDLANHHADPAAPFTANEARRMERAWHIETETPVTHDPVVSGDRVFFTDWGGTVYAADWRAGDVLWQRQVQEPGEIQSEWPWHSFAGTGTVGDGMLFEASVEGVAYALDQETGEVLWETRITDDPQGGNVGTLTYFDGRLFVPLQSVEEPLSAMMPDMPIDFTGEVLVLDARTGEVMLQQPTVEPPGTGVAVWSGFAVDPDLGLAYFTTGNNYKAPETALSDAVVAMDYRTGDFVWHRQVTEQDIWTKAEPLGPDYDFGAAPQLFEAVVDGQRRRLVGAGQKSGVYYVWDRVTGEPVWSVTVGFGEVGGGIHAEASVGEDRMIIWGNNSFPYKDPGEHPMDVKAVDLATGDYLWVNPTAQPAALATAGYLAGDVYFVGSLDGKVRAYAAADGERVWTSPDHAAIGSSLVVHDGVLMFGTGALQTWDGDTEGGTGLFAYRAAD